MVTRFPRLRFAGELPLALAAAGLTFLISLAAAQKLGTIGLLAPLGVVVMLVLVLRPALTVSLVVGLVVACEGSTFGLFTFTSELYEPIVKDLTILDGMVAFAILSVITDLIRNRRKLWVPTPLKLSQALLGFAIIAGTLTAKANGVTLHLSLVSEHILAYLLLMPIAVANLNLSRQQVCRLLIGLMALAVIKAGLGLIEIAGGYGQSIEETTHLTYYEPTANWLMLLGIFGVVAAVLARNRLPRWILLGTPLLVACLLFSYRRSFWIAAVLGFVLLLILGSSRTGRRLLFPIALAMIASIWVLGSVHFQSQLSVVKRAESLSPTKLDTNADDRYRLDERANVWGEIIQHPITGLGMDVPWEAIVQPLSVEHPEGRLYVHFAALWFWLKLGVLGLLAYLGILITSAWLSWRTWRRSPEPLLRMFGLGSLCAIAGLAVIETTATFTGVDPRFTLLLAAQIGLLAVASETAPERTATG